MGSTTKPTTRTTARFAHALSIAAEFIACALIMSSLASPAIAQQAPEVGYAFPPGIQAGATSTLTLGGYDWTPDLQFFVRDKRVKLEIIGEPGPMLVPPPPYWFGPKARGPAMLIPRKVQARITIPPELAGEVIEWQVANANGASSVGSIAVATREEITEVESSDATMTLPALPVTINARLSRLEEIDRYRIRRQKSGLVTIQVITGQIGSPIQPVLRIHDDQDNRVGEAVEAQGRDLFLTFRAEANRDYTASLHDLDFRGNRAHVYRMQVTSEPRIVAAIPAGGQRGTTAEVTFIGYGIASGTPILESLTRKVTFPDAASSSVFVYQLTTEHGKAQITLPLCDHPEVSEQKAGGKLPEIPFAVTGTLNKRGQVDRYQMTLAKGDVVDVLAAASSLDSPLDTTLTITSAEGKQLATADDADESTDARLQFKAPSDGTYDIAVADVANRSGRLDAAYRLVIAPPVPMFDITVPTQLSLPLGGKATLKATPVRSNGFTGDIHVSIEELPAGITYPDGQVISGKKKDVSIPITVDAGLSSDAFFADVVARSEFDGKPVEKRHRILFARTMKPRATVTPVDKDGGRTVHRGTTYPADVIVERLEGFQGPVLLQMAAKQGRHRQGITSSDVLVPPEVTRTVFPVFCPEWLETDRTSRMVVNAITVVDDPTGKTRYLSNKMDGRITMSLEGALLKVSAPSRLIVATAGDAIDVPVTIARSPKFRESVTLSLVVNEEQKEPFQGSSLNVPLDQPTATLRIQTPKKAAGIHELLIRGNAMQDGRYPAVSQTTIRLLLKP